MIPVEGLLESVLKCRQFAIRILWIAETLSADYYRILAVFSKLLLMLRVLFTTFVFEHSPVKLQRAFS